MVPCRPRDGFPVEPRHRRLAGTGLLALDDDVVAAGAANHAHPVSTDERGDAHRPADRARRGDSPARLGSGRPQPDRRATVPSRDRPPAAPARMRAPVAPAPEPDSSTPKHIKHPTPGRSKAEVQPRANTIKAARGHRYPQIARLLEHTSGHPAQTPTNAPRVAP